MALSPLSKDQWRKVITALGYSFVSTFIGTFIAAGGIRDSHEATIASGLAALVAAVNGTLYAASQVFKDDTGAQSRG